jgi:hypothetical protein
MFADKAGPDRIDGIEMQDAFPTDAAGLFVDPTIMFAEDNAR